MSRSNCRAILGPKLFFLGKSTAPLRCAVWVPRYLCKAERISKQAETKFMQLIGKISSVISSAAAMTDFYMSIRDNSLEPPGSDCFSRI